MTDISVLADRAMKRAKAEDSEYWQKAAVFLHSQIGKGRGDRTQKQNNWITELRQELWQPGD